MGGVVGLASCVWPYARLALLLLCLWSPPARLPPRRCLLLLRVCDGLGKFALVDFVMLNLLTVVLRIDASLPRAATRATLAAAGNSWTAASRKDDPKRVPLLADYLAGSPDDARARIAE